MVEKNKPEMPRCGYKGCLPHAAEPAYLIVWSLPRGPVVKWSCADHRFSFGGNRPPVVAKVEHFAEDEPSPTHSESGDEMEQATCVDPAAAAAAVRPQKNETSTAPTEDICIRCRKSPALPDPLGCGGQLCQRCVDLQNAEYRQWVVKQRALGNIPFGNGEPEMRLVR
jgi:hypothetical protein